MQQAMKFRKKTMVKKLHLKMNKQEKALKMQLAEP